ncbi:hypothetical protein AKO1_006219 [Acrasis kona]|uniref:Uncharacterized protein n=1 Tax=Acrasis kona TaxID=1008807 RepID=A0AAW2YJM9_9EUKA
MKLSRQLVAQSHKHIFPTFSSYRKFGLSKPLFNGQIDTFFQKVTQGDASSVRSLLVNDKELLKHKYDGVDNQEKVLAFTIAAQNGCYDVLEAMIEADPNLIKMEEEFQRSKDGLSALQQIIANLGEVIMGWKPAPTPLQNMNVDRHRCIYLLVSSGTCDLNFNRSDGWTPLMLASRFGLYHVVSMLIEHGASLTLKAAQGQTALHVAAEFERTPVALLLLSHDASLADVKDHRGDDFFSIVEQDQKDFALKLLSYGIEEINKHWKY